MLVAFGSSAVAQNRTFTNQYTFGDSLSDNGNAYLASGRTINTLPQNFGGRWSNGPTFVELLGNNLAIGSTAAPTVKSSMDFAFGGATAVTAVSTVPFPSLPVQLQLFQSHSVAVQKTDLFTVWMGANDILNTAAQANPSAMAPAGGAAANATASAIQSLITLGAKNILVLGMPDIGLTPAGLSSGGGSLLTAGSLAYNAAFDIRLAAIAASAPDVTITRIDAAALIARIQVDFKALGFANATSGLILPASQGGGGDPNGYAFFDGIHPSARTHALLAGIVTEALNPEPVVGFAASEGTAALALQSLAAAGLDTRLSQLASTPRATGRADAYASFHYGSGDRVADGLRPKFSYEGQVVTAGVDSRLCDGFFLGGAFGTGRLNAKLSAAAGSYTMEDQSGRLYGVWRGGPVAFAFDGDYGVMTLKGAHRATAFGGFQTDGKASGTHWGAGIKASWNADFGGVQMRPWLGLRTERVKLPAYTEGNVPALAMAYAAQEAKSSAGSIGFEVASGSKIAGHDVHFDFSAAWHGEFGNNTRNVSGRLANNFTPPTTIGTTDGDGRGLEFSLGGTVSIAKNLSATLGYAGDIRQHDKLANRVGLTFQTGF